MRENFAGHADCLAQRGTAARQQQATSGLDLLIVDYLSLIRSENSRQPRWETVSEISTAIKRLAKELAVPVIALQQLNREADRQVPQLSHLRESGAIETESKYSTDECVDDTQFNKALRKLGKGDLRIHLNSPGGSVDQGLAIFNTLKNHQGKITIVNDSICASAASFIYCAGHVRLTNRHSHFMLHLPHTATGGNSADLRKMADLLDVYGKTMIDVYLHRMNISQSELVQMLAVETWLDAADALRLNLATEIIGQGQASTAAAARLIKFPGQQPTDDKVEQSKRRLAGLAVKKSHSAQFAAQCRTERNRVRINCRRNQRDCRQRLQIVGMNC